MADLVGRGADVIKIALEPGSADDPWPVLNLQEVQAIVQEAHTAHTLWCKAPNLTAQQTQGCYEFYEEPVGQFHALGGTIALANDSGADDAIGKGIPLREMQLLLAAGLTPMEVIQASTRNSARVCGHDGELGTLEPGKLADVIVVAGDPLANIEAMSNVVVGVKAGQVAYQSK